MLKQIIIGVFIFITGISLAQEGTTSPYSFYGIGIQKFKGTAENRSMGGISIFSDSIHLNLQNPAGVADLELVTYSIGGSHKYVNQENGYPIPSIEVPVISSNHPGIPNVYSAFESWQSADIIELQNRMRFAFEDRIKNPKKIEGIKCITEYSYAKIGEKIKNVLTS